MTQSTARASGAIFRPMLCIWTGLLLVWVGGCASATEKGFNAGLSGIDLQQMTEQMAVSLAGNAKVQQAAAEEGTLRVVVEPVENYMTGEVLPDGQRKAFVGRIRALLQRQTPEMFTWVANRDAYYWARQQELDGIDPGPNPERIQPRYALKGRFDSLTNVSAVVRSVSYLCVFELIDLDSGQRVWIDSYELKKTAVKGFLD